MSDVDWKAENERMISKFKEQLDFYEELVANGAVPAALLLTIFKKLVTDQEKRLSLLSSQSSGSNDIDVKPLAVKKEEKKPRTVKNEKDPDIEVIDVEDEEEDEVQSSQSTKRSRGNEKTDEINKRLKPTPTDLIGSTNVETNNLNDQQEQDEEAHYSPFLPATSVEQSPPILPSSSASTFSNSLSFPCHDDIDNFEGSNLVCSNQNRNIVAHQTTSLYNQEEGEEEVTENSNMMTNLPFNPPDEEFSDISAQEPSTSPNNSSNLDIEPFEYQKDDSSDGSERYNEDFFTPIYCPQVTSNFWSMTETEKEDRVVKFAIHNYPRNLGKENDPDYRSRFGTGLWFLLNDNVNGFSYKKLEELTTNLNNLKIWLQLQLSDFHDEQLDSFLTTFGKCVTHFTFERRLTNYEQITEQEFSSLLFEKLYNVEYLVLDEDYISPNSNEQQEQRQLPHLKTIQFINTKFTFSSDFIEPILKSSQNLEFVHNLPLKFVSIIISLEKSERVKSVEMHRSDAYTSREAYAQDLMTLAKSKIALEKLEIPAYFNEPNGNQIPIPMSYRRFYKTSRNSLQELHIEPTIEWSQLSQLVNLRTLQINIYGFAPHYSNQLDINKTFPKVRVLIVNYWPSKKEYSLSPQKFFEKYFPHKIFIPGKSLQSVDELRLVNDFPVGCMQNMSVLLPRISTLCWNCTLPVFREALPFCWSLWLRVETLIFQVELAERRDDFEYVDSALLGFPEEICEKLRNGTPIENVDEFERKPSILDLKSLKRLEIEIQEPNCADEDAEMRIFSQMVASQGFAKVQEINPRFKVQVTFHSNCSAKYVQNVRRNLQPLLSFVKIEF